MGQKKLKFFFFVSSKNGVPCKMVIPGCESTKTALKAKVAEVQKAGIEIEDMKGFQTRLANLKIGAVKPVEEKERTVRATAPAAAPQLPSTDPRPAACAPTSAAVPITAVPAAPASTPTAPTALAPATAAPTTPAQPP